MQVDKPQRDRVNEYSVYSLSGINMAPHSESKWNSVGFVSIVCNSDAKLQKVFNLAMVSRRVALSDNASLIATFSSWRHCALLYWAYR